MTWALFIARSCRIDCEPGTLSSERRSQGLARLYRLRLCCGLCRLTGPPYPTPAAFGPFPRTALTGLGEPTGPRGVICGDCSDDGKPAVGCGVATVEVGPPVIDAIRAGFAGVAITEVGPPSGTKWSVRGEGSWRRVAAEVGGLVPLSEHATQISFPPPSMQRKSCSPPSSMQRNLVPPSPHATQISFLYPSIKVRLSSPLSSRTAFGTGTDKTRTARGLRGLGRGPGYCGWGEY